MHSIEPITVGVIPTQLNASRTWAVVYVSGVENPNGDDWIGLFALPDGESTINANKHAPVKFKVRNSHTYQNFVHFQYQDLSASSCGIAMDGLLVVHSNA